MKTQSVLIAALASAPAALAHTAFTNFYVDGLAQGDAVAMRMSMNSETTTNPIRLDSDAMACNVGGTKGVSRVQSVKDGALLSFEMRAWPSDPSKERIDQGHKGPCAVYAKKVSSAIEDSATGNGWFKLMEDGYDSSSKEWCTDRLIANNGLLNVKLPQGLAGGSYLVRPEVLALHAADKGDPQIYTGCAQIFLESSGNLVPESTVSIPGHMNYDEPSTNFNIYQQDASTYKMPGPKVATFKANNGAKTASNVKAQSEGQKPAGCLVENGNWCGFEVSDYSSEKGCWASAEECFKQGEKCYSSAPPTGQAGCELWASKCTGIQSQCSAGNFNGPPNKNKVMTPSKKTIDVGAVLGNVAKGVANTLAKVNAAAAPMAASPSKVMPLKQKAAIEPTPVVDSEVEVVTQYVTVAYDAYTKRNGGLHGRRHAARHL